jgi:hypothetical protein
MASMRMIISVVAALAATTPAHALENRDPGAGATKGCTVDRAILRLEDGRTFKANGYAEAKVRLKPAAMCGNSCWYEKRVIRGWVGCQTAYLETEVMSGMSGGWWSSTTKLMPSRIEHRLVRLDWSKRPPKAPDFGFENTGIHDGPFNGRVQTVVCQKR